MWRWTVAAEVVSALALAGGLLAAGKLFRQLLVLPAQLLQPRGAVHTGLLLRSADQPAADRAAPGLGAQAVAAIALRLEPGDLGAERLGLGAAVGLLLGGQQEARAAVHAVQYARGAREGAGQRNGQAGWPAAGLVDTEIRFSNRIGGFHAATSVRPGVHA